MPCIINRRSNQSLARITVMTIAIVLIAGGIQSTGQVAVTHDLPAFEVASVKRNLKEGMSTLSLPPVGQVRFIDAQLGRIVALAYGIELNLQQYRLVGGDNDVLSARFDISAKPPDNARPGDNRLMLQRLLAERFGLRIHEELRETPVYAITVRRAGQLGPRLKRTTTDCDAFIAAGGKRTGANVPRDSGGQPLCWLTYGFDEAGPETLRLSYAGPVSTLARLAQPFVDRPIVESTGLQGNFEWSVTFRYEFADERANAPLLFQAFEEQLGFRLVPHRAPYPVLVIDSVEFPSPD